MPALRSLRPAVVPVLRAIRRYYLEVKRPRVHRQIRELGHTPTRPLTLVEAERLTRSWGIGAGPDPRFLVEVAERAASAQGPILECGSGLTTLVAAAYAAQSVWSLEHHFRYGEVVRRSLAHSGLDNSVTILHAPLIDYRRFTWYSVPRKLPNTFDLVICDGPPSDTPGGRYGLLPIMAERLSSSTIILLDDARRPDEQEILSAWRAYYSLAELGHSTSRHAVLAFR